MASNTGARSPGEALMTPSTLAHGITPPLRHAAPVGRPAVAQARRSLGMCRPVARLPLRRCHRFSRRLRPALQKG
jgi:hypothetical protein